MDVAAIWRCDYKHQEMEELNDVIHRALIAWKREKLRKEPSTEWLRGIEFLNLKSRLKRMAVEIPQFENLRQNTTKMHNYGIAKIGRGKNW